MKTDADISAPLRAAPSGTSRRASARVLSLTLLACGNPTLKAAPDGGGTFIVPPTTDRSDGLSSSLRDGGSRPDRLPTLCTKLAPEHMVTDDAQGVGSLAIQWTGTRYVLAFEERSDMGDIRLEVLAADGTPNGAPVAIESTPTRSVNPALAKSDTEYLLFWEERTSPRQVRARRLDTNGAPIGAAVQIAVSTGAEVRPVVARTPLGLALVYMDVVDGHSVSRLALLDTTTLAIRTDVPAIVLGAAGSVTSHPSVTGDASHFAAVYTETNSSGTDVHVALIGANLAVTKDVVVRAGLGGAVLSRAIVTPFGYLTTWEDSRTGDNEIYAASLSPAGLALGGGLLQEDNSGDGNWSHMAWHDDVGAVVFYQFRFGKPNVFLTYVDRTCQRIEGRADFRVSDSPVEASSRYPDIAWNGTDFAIAWEDGRSGSHQAYFARVACVAPLPR